jgi:hypothetical protein
MYIAKDEQKNVKFKACDFREEMKAIINMTTITLKKTSIMDDQSVLVICTIPKDKVLNEEA